MKFLVPRPLAAGLTRSEEASEMKHYTGMWYCRHYFVTEGTLGLALGFGTSNRDEKFELYEKMAKSFEFDT